MAKKSATKPGAPTPRRVFVSYTGEDLAKHAKVVLDAIRKLGWVGIDHQDWAASGKDAVAQCLAQVRMCDILVVLVAHRRGWVPKKSDGGDGKKSITRLEVEAARRANLEVLPFLVDEGDDARWPTKHIEALNDPAVAKPLADFKKVLNATIRATFTDDPQSLSGPAYHALKEAGDRLDAEPAGKSGRTSRPRDGSGSGAPLDRARYLKHIEATYGSVVLTGLLKDKATASKPIESIYVPLRATRTNVRPSGLTESMPGRASALDSLVKLLADSRARGRAHKPRSIDDAVVAALLELGVPEDDARRPESLRATVTRVTAEEPVPGPTRVRDILSTVEFEDAFRGAPHLLIEGDPGSGKTTTLFHVAMTLVDAHRGDPAGAARMGFRRPFPVPIVVVLRAFRAWLAAQPGTSRAADVLLAHLRETEAPLGGSPRWIDAALEGGNATVLIDGMDEVADADGRDRVASIVADFVERFKACRFAVSSRPAGLSGDVRRKLVDVGGLTECRVQPLDVGLQERFVRSWYRALVNDPKDADRRASDLVARIQRSPSVQELADTPILLTAITVIHQTGGQLPERRAELYEHCVRALAGLWEEAKGPEGKRLAGPLSIDAKVNFLEEVAWRAHTAGPAVDRIERGPLVALAQEEFGRALSRGLDRMTGERLLDEFGERSGLLIPVGAQDFRFRHQSFREFLAATRMFDRSEDPTRDVLERLTDPLWRNVLVLALGFKAMRQRAEAKALLRKMIESARSAAGPHAGLAAWRVIAEAVRDLTKYDVPELENVARSAFSGVVACLDGPAKDADEQDRSVLFEFLGSHGPDPRLSAGERWVRVPPGTFQLADESFDLDGTSPTHPVEVAAFEFQRWATTIDEFARFMDEGRYTSKGRPSWSAEGWRWREKESIECPREWDAQRSGPTNRPVVGVSFWEAEAYCRWLGARLPTSEEREHATRAGSTTTYWSGDTEPDLARAGWYDMNSGEHVHCVGEKPANPLGLWDVHGNVWEWCSTEESGDRVVRGGSWLAPAWFARSAFRYRFDPRGRDGFLGFRPARSVPPV